MAGTGIHEARLGCERSTRLPCRLYQGAVGSRCAACAARLSVTMAECPVMPVSGDLDHLRRHAPVAWRSPSV